MAQNKVAIVTGSTSGIGLAIAQELARQGYATVLNSFTDTDQDHAAAAAITKASGAESIYVQADMSKPDQCRELVRTAAKRLGSVDVLINNAGIQHVAPVEAFPPERWDAIIAINLSSTFHTIAEAVPHLRKAGSGRIVNVASAHGLVASPFKSAYVAAKHGVIGLTKSVALELARDRITCNAVCPGYVLTPIIEAQIPDQMKTHKMDRETVIREVMLARQPTGEFVTVEQVAGAVLYLCSDAAASVTGTHISIDGGWTAL